VFYSCFLLKTFLVILCVAEAYVKGPLLGRGGFGSVYAGTRRSDGLPVRHFLTSRTFVLQEGQGRLPLEVALMTLVNSAPACPNVLQLLEWFDRPGRTLQYAPPEWFRWHRYHAG
uniref:non-specific serine/threonine protein kinase n=1 Tax=Sinocyclocheilus anshuiensis TaxID=1608454 RepID=A0A671KLA9_9TELE